MHGFGQQYLIERTIRDRETNAPVGSAEVILKNSSRATAASEQETGLEIRRFMVRDFRYIEKCEFLNDRLYFLYQPDMGKRIKKLFSIWI